MSRAYSMVNLRTKRIGGEGDTKTLGLAERSETAADALGLDAEESGELVRFRSSASPVRNVAMPNPGEILLLSPLGVGVGARAGLRVYPAVQVGWRRKKGYTYQVDKLETQQHIQDVFEKSDNSIQVGDDISISLASILPTPASGDLDQTRA